LKCKSPEVADLNKILGWLCDNGCDFELGVAKGDFHEFLNDAGEAGIEESCGAASTWSPRSSRDIDLLPIGLSARTFAAAAACPAVDAFGELRRSGVADIEGA